MVHIQNDTDRYWNLFLIGCKVINGGARCRTIETLAERTTTIAAVPDSFLDSIHSSQCFHSIPLVRTLQRKNVAAQEHKNCRFVQTLGLINF